MCTINRTWVFSARQSGNFLTYPTANGSAFKLFKLEGIHVLILAISLVFSTRSRNCVHVHLMGGYHAERSNERFTQPSYHRSGQCSIEIGLCVHQWKETKRCKKERLRVLDGRKEDASVGNHILSEVPALQWYSLRSSFTSRLAPSHWYLPSSRCSRNILGIYGLKKFAPHDVVLFHNTVWLLLTITRAMPSDMFSTLRCLNLRARGRYTGFTHHSTI